MEYYTDLITQESFEILKSLRRRYKFTLIGGWAVFLYTRSLKSKDIDIVVDYEEIGRLRQDFDLFKNERLKKYEIRSGGVEIDVYVPFFSDPGIPAEELKNYARSLEGFLVVEPEVLMILKLSAWQERKGTPKGEKDRLDILTLASFEGFSWEKFLALTKKYRKESLLESFLGLVKEQKPSRELPISFRELKALKEKARDLGGMKGG